MISTVAVGYDGTSTAGEALATAAELAQAFGAKLVLLSAFHGSAGPLEGENVEMQWAHNPSAVTSELIEKAASDLNDRGIDCRTMVAEGNPGDVLVRLADECSADVLVIGNKGMNRRFLGSVPKTVTHDAGCSVFVVRTTS